MRQLNKVILCLGSNWNKENNMERAIEALRPYFVSFRLSDGMYTEPIDCPQTGTFLNQVVLGYTFRTCPELKSAFKEIERLLGRTPTSKRDGVIPVDIDLLQWNGEVLKPSDMEREYVVSGLSSLVEKTV